GRLGPEIAPSTPIGAINRRKEKENPKPKLPELAILTSESSRRRLHSTARSGEARMPKPAGDAKLLIQSLTKAYAATPTNLKIIDLYVVFAVATALVQVVYMGIVGSFPFNSFLSGVLSCIGTAVLGGRNFFLLPLQIEFILPCLQDM
uniref:Dolichyl-diphosphooligosaccharide--protein glycosyltransferase subunit DAD1 n=1 Tax=Aegilops tauschii subsp. strangulata TaxID=200361 RepID=A0A453QE03_AEGTS